MLHENVDINIEKYMNLKYYSNLYKLSRKRIVRSKKKIFYAKLNELFDKLIK